MIVLNGPYHIGSLRWNGMSRQMEVMDQTGSWQAIDISESSPLPMPADTYELLQWAREEKARREQLKNLREKYLALDQALSKAEVIEALVSE